MQKLQTLLAAAVLVLFSTSVGAQFIDLGRGELPVTVPANYDAGSPAPLIVLLHGYTSSGAGQDSYMGFSAIADTYGFLLVSPDGDKENQEGMRIASGMLPLPAATFSNPTLMILPTSLTSSMKSKPTST